LEFLLESLVIEELRFRPRRSGRFAKFTASSMLNAVAMPLANGQYERYNKTIVQALATTMAGRDPSDWDLAVKQVQNALNTMHNSINTTPMNSSDVRQEV